MRFSYLWAVLALSLLASPSRAADLTKIDRTIAKEPAYKEKPKYCLLVFGPEAKFRTWLVLDGDLLYVDRNGTGDLTGDGKQVKGSVRTFPNGTAVQTTFHQAGEVTDPDGTKTRLSVSCWQAKAGAAPGVSIKTYEQSAGSLLFAEQPQDAPIVHFGGPLTIMLSQRPILYRGQTWTFEPIIGTPGLGQNTFAHASLGMKARDIKKNNPEQMPLAEIELPGKTAAEPIKLTVKFEPDS